MDKKVVLTGIRQGDAEYRPLIYTGVACNGAAMAGHNLFGDGKAKAGSLLFPRLIG